MTIKKMFDIFDWVTLRDYTVAKEQATNEIVERLCRGNTSAQDGASMEEEELASISQAADAAMTNIAKHATL